MKKLRMIVKSVIVLAIVGSAFAFKIKAGAFCVLDAAATGSHCTTFITGKRTVSVGGIPYKYAQFWDGNKTTCTAANNFLCAMPEIRFAND